MIVGVGPVPVPLIGAPAGRISEVRMGRVFSPALWYRGRPDNGLGDGTAAVLCCHSEDISGRLGGGAAPAKACRCCRPTIRCWGGRSCRHFTRCRTVATHEPTFQVPFLVAGMLRDKASDMGPGWYERAQLHVCIDPLGTMAMTRVAGLSRKILLIQIAIAGILFFTMAVVKTYPLIMHFDTHIPGDLGDPLLNAWILAWDFHALTTDPWNLFNANILYPAEKTLAFSEHLLGVLPIFAPAYALSQNPILAYNMVFFLSFPLSGIALFLLVHHWTRTFWAALLSGFLFAFAPTRFGQYTHLQLLNLYWAPLVLLFLERFLHSKTWKDLFGFAIFYWLQSLSSVYLGWFTTIAVVLYVLCYALFIDRELLSRRMISRYATFITLSLLILLPLHLPYYEVKRQWGLSRSLQECVFYSADILLSYFSVSFLMNDLYIALFRFANSSFAGGEKNLFLGFVILTLATIGSLSRGGILCHDAAKRMKRVFWLILSASAILSLGPYLVVLDRKTRIPLPYLLLYQLVPGFSAMRAPARFGLMVTLAASVLTALGFLQICDYLHGRGYFRNRERSRCEQSVALLCLGVFVLELGWKPLPLAKVQTGLEVPEVYRWLAGKNFTGAVVELPFGHWQDYRYAYFSAYHWLPLVNGTSGFMPPTYSQLMPELNVLPSRGALESLSAIGGKWVVVHTDQLQPHEAQQWRQANLAETGLEKVAAFGSDVVYKLPALEVTHQMHLEFLVPANLPVKANPTLRLLAKGIGPHPWTHPRPLGRTKSIVEWKETSSARTSRHEEELELPLVIRADDIFQMGIPVRTPPSPGHYLLTLRLPSFDINTGPKLIELRTDPFPTSRNSSQLLKAAYELEDSPLPSVTSQTGHISVKVVNTGGAVWLAHAKGDRGAVRLGWRWFKGDQEVPHTSGRELLPYDVFPGQAYVFKAGIRTPPEPGEYTLELGLVSEGVTWFSDRGVEPLKLRIYTVNRR